MQEIRIKTIPHNSHRYQTSGDWLIAPDGALEIYVSDMGEPDFEWLVAMHELTEAWIYLRSGGTQKEADDFDMGHPEMDEPGCEHSCPYHKAHEAGETVERVLTMALGIDHHVYDAAFEKLEWKHDPERRHAD